MSIALLFEYYINNKEKDEYLKLSEKDEKMINHLDEFIHRYFSRGGGDGFFYTTNINLFKI